MEQYDGGIRYISQNIEISLTDKDFIKKRKDYTSTLEEINKIQVESRMIFK